MSITTSAPVPLTTTFTPPSSCINELWAFKSSKQTWMNLGPTDTSACLPSGWATSSYFTPGICPSDYGIAKTTLVDSGSSTETIATCCPIAESSTYSLRPTTATDSADWYTREVCAWGPDSDVITEYTYTWTGSDGSKTSTTDEMSSPGSVNAFGIEIRWQSTDFSSVPATASATATPDSPTSTSSQDSAGSDSSSGLSSGAKAGIGVGVAAGVVVVAILALLFFWFRRRKARQAASVPIPQSPHDAYPPNAYGHDMYGDGGQVAELSAARNKPFTYQKAELSAEMARMRPVALE